MSIVAINARNQFKGIIKHIIDGPVVSEVEVETPGGIVTSVITTSSLKQLDLHVGSEVLAVVKSTEVALAKLL
ncbi:MAG: transporter [Methylococcaceae bacterium]|nr:MAG: transporter [Methylococcaceae bacterium]